MKVSKLSISTAAAVAVIGAFGFAYAQTGPYSSDGTTLSSPPAQNQSMTPDSSMQNQPSSGSTGAVGAAPNDTSNMANERVPKPTATDRRIPRGEFAAGQAHSAGNPRYFYVESPGASLV